MMSIDRMSMAGSAFGNLLPWIADGLHQYRVRLLLALDLSLADALTTQIGLAAGLPEGNPIPATLIASGGTGAWLGAKFAVLAAIVLLVCLLGRRYPKLWHTFTVTNLVLLVAVLSNSAQILSR